jgi:hypothetical protein
MKIIFIVPILLLTFACHSLPVHLIHPATGKAVQCGPYGIQSSNELARENKCISDYEAQGFKRFQPVEQ